LIACFDTSKLSSAAAKAARAAIENASPNCHAIAAVALPMVLVGMDEKKMED
jgi:hypothetical protein